MKSISLRGIIASVLLFGSAYQAASALSCMAPTPKGQFAKFEQSPDEYHIFEGRITMLKGGLMLDDHNSRGVRAPVKALFQGRQLGPDGTQRWRKSFNLTVNIGCAGSWCGGFPSAEKQIYFLKYDGDYSVTMGPCGGANFPATPEVRQTLMACFNGGCHAVGVPEPEPEPEPEPRPEPSPVPKDTCGKDYLQALIGKSDDDLPEFLRNNRSVRVIPPNTYVTMDYVLTRLNIYTDARGQIQSLKCG